MQYNHTNLCINILFSFEVNLLQFHIFQTFKLHLFNLKALDNGG